MPEQPEVSQKRGAIRRPVDHSPMHISEIIQRVSGALPKTEVSYACDHRAFKVKGTPGRRDMVASASRHPPSLIDVGVIHSQEGYIVSDAAASREQQPYPLFAREGCLYFLFDLSCIIL